MSVFCKDCRHAKGDTPHYVCHAPGLGYNLVTGEQRTFPCDVLRGGAGDVNGACGSVGEWFEPKETAK